MKYLLLVLLLLLTSCNWDLRQPTAAPIQIGTCITYKSLNKDCGQKPTTYKYVLKIIATGRDGATYCCGEVEDKYESGWYGCNSTDEWKWLLTRFDIVPCPDWDKK